MPEDEKGVDTPETPASEEVVTPPAADALENNDSDDSDESPSEQMVPISELRKIRSEAAASRKKLQALQDQQRLEKKEADLAKMEETDRLKTIAADAEAKALSLKQRADTVAKKSAIVNAASVLGFHNPGHAAGILNLDEIIIDDVGNIDEGQITDMLNQLSESSPYLIKKEEKISELGGGPTNPLPSKGSQPRTLKFTDADKIKQMQEQARQLALEGKAMEANELSNRAWEAQRDLNK